MSYFLNSYELSYYFVCIRGLSLTSLEQMY